MVIWAYSSDLAVNVILLSLLLSKLLLRFFTSLLNTPRKMHKSKLSQNFYTIGRNNEAKSLSSNLDSSKIKSKSFTTTVDQYSQIAVTVSGTIIAAIAARYLVIVQEDNRTLRLFGNIGQYQLNRVNQGTIVNVMVFYL